MATLAAKRKSARLAGLDAPPVTVLPPSRRRASRAPLTASSPPLVR